MGAMASQISLTIVYLTLREHQGLLLINDSLCSLRLLYCIRISKDYVCGIWVYKLLGIWKGYYGVNKSLISYMKLVNQGKK